MTPYYILFDPFSNEPSRGRPNEGNGQERAEERLKAQRKKWDHTPDLSRMTRQVRRQLERQGKIAIKPRIAK